MNEELLNVLNGIKENLDLEIQNLNIENSKGMNPLDFVKNYSKIEVLNHIINDYIVPTYNHYANFKEDEVDN